MKQQYDSPYRQKINKRYRILTLPNIEERSSVQDQDFKRYRHILSSNDDHNQFMDNNNNSKKNVKLSGSRQTKPFTPFQSKKIYRYKIKPKRRHMVESMKIKQPDEQQIKVKNIEGHSRQNCNICLQKNDGQTRKTLKRHNNNTNKWQQYIKFPRLKQYLYGKNNPEQYHIQRKQKLEFFQTLNIFHYQTYYAKHILNPQPQQLHKIIKCLKKIDIPSIPQKMRLQQFVENYVCRNREINMKTLIKWPSFLIEYTSQELFFGQMFHSARSGRGILLTRHKLFEGMFVNGHQHKGIQINKAGIYKGEFNRNNKRQGKGQFQWFSGEYYVGQWKNGVRHGNGLWMDGMGNSYYGGWAYSRPIGLCKFVQKNRQYRGNFNNFRRQGWGKQIFKNGDIYEGQFKDNQPNGKGIYIWKDGTKYEGQFRNGLRDGLGYMKTFQSLTFNGQFFEQKIQGLSEINFNGDTYTGYILNEKKNGEGLLIIDSKKQIYDGIWENDQLVQPTVRC